MDALSSLSRHDGGAAAVEDAPMTPAPIHGPKYESTTKESFAYFRARRDKWDARDRRKIQPIVLTPLKRIQVPRQVPYTQMKQQQTATMIAAAASTVAEDGSGPKEASFFAAASPATVKTSTLSDATAMPQSTTQQVAPRPTLSTLANTTTTISDYRTRLVQFYKQKNPSKLDSVDETLATYQGREDELFDKLETKYSLPMPFGTGPVCYLEITGYGKITIQLFADKCPLACENFRALCTGELGTGRKGKPLCYRGSFVHRIVPNFCIQAGDFTNGDGTGGESIYAPGLPHTDLWGNFVDEMFMQHSEAGLLSMANNGKNRNSSQFFLTLGPSKQLNGKHVVFGKVIDGMDAVVRLGNAATDDKQRPLERIMIKDCGAITDETATRQLEDHSCVSSQGSVPASNIAPPAGIFGASTAASPISFGSLTGQTATPFGQAPFASGVLGTIQPATTPFSPLAGTKHVPSLFGGSAPMPNASFGVAGTSSFGASTFGAFNQQASPSLFTTSQAFSLAPSTSYRESAFNGKDDDDDDDDNRSSLSSESENSASSQSSHDSAGPAIEGRSQSTYPVAAVSLFQQIEPLAMSTLASQTVPFDSLGVSDPTPFTITSGLPSTSTVPFNLSAAQQPKLDGQMTTHDTGVSDLGRRSTFTTSYREVASMDHVTNDVNDARSHTSGESHRYGSQQWSDKLTDPLFLPDDDLDSSKHKPVFSSLPGVRHVGAPVIAYDGSYGIEPIGLAFADSPEAVLRKKYVDMQFPTAKQLQPSEDEMKMVGSGPISESGTDPPSFTISSNSLASRVIPSNESLLDASAMLPLKTCAFTLSSTFQQNGGCEVVLSDGRLATQGSLGKAISSVGPLACDCSQSPSITGDTSSLLTSDVLDSAYSVRDSSTKPSLVKNSAGSMEPKTTQFASREVNRSRVPRDEITDFSSKVPVTADAPSHPILDVDKAVVALSAKLHKIEGPQTDETLAPAKDEATEAATGESIDLSASRSYAAEDRVLITGDEVVTEFPLYSERTSDDFAATQTSTASMERVGKFVSIAHWQCPDVKADTDEPGTGVSDAKEPLDHSDQKLSEYLPQPRIVFRATSMNETSNHNAEIALGDRSAATSPITTLETKMTGKQPEIFMAPILSLKSSTPDLAVSGAATRATNNLTNAIYDPTWLAPSDARCLEQLSSSSALARVVIASNHGLAEVEKVDDDVDVSHEVYRPVLESDHFVASGSAENKCLKFSADSPSSSSVPFTSKAFLPSSMMAVSRASCLAKPMFASAIAPPRKKQHAKPSDDITGIAAAVGDTEETKDATHFYCNAITSKGNLALVMIRPTQQLPSLLEVQLSEQRKQLLLPSRANRNTLPVPVPCLPVTLQAQSSRALRLTKKIVDCDPLQLLICPKSPLAADNAFAICEGVDDQDTGGSSVSFDERLSSLKGSKESPPASDIDRFMSMPVSLLELQLTEQRIQAPLLWPSHVRPPSNKLSVHVASFAPAFSSDLLLAEVYFFYTDPLWLSLTCLNTEESVALFVVKLQRLVRGALARRVGERRCKSVTLIQHVMRGFLVRKCYGSRQLRIRKQRAAVARIQRRFRVNLAKHQSQERRCALQQYGAAISIQTRVRAWKARRRYHRVKVATVSIQRTARRFAARRSRVQMLRLEAENDAAGFLQRLCRGFLARLYYEKRRREMVTAVILIQSVGRRHFTARKFETRRLQSEHLRRRQIMAAISIQNGVRSHFAKVIYGSLLDSSKKTKAAAMLIQYVWRRSIACRGDCLSMADAAVDIQCAWRVAKARRAYSSRLLVTERARHSAATAIQCLLRSQRRKREYKSRLAIRLDETMEVATAAQIQRVSRSWLDRKACRQTWEQCVRVRDSAINIQRVLRSFLERKKLSIRKSCNTRHALTGVSHVEGSGINVSPVSSGRSTGVVTGWRTIIASTGSEPPGRLSFPQKMDDLVDDWQDLPVSSKAILNQAPAMTLPPATGAVPTMNDTGERICDTGAHDSDAIDSEVSSKSAPLEQSGGTEIVIGEDVSDGSMENDIKEQSQVPGQFFSLIQRSAAGVMFGKDRASQVPSRPSDARRVSVSEGLQAIEEMASVVVDKRLVFGASAGLDVSFQSVAASSSTEEAGGSPNVNQSRVGGTDVTYELASEASSSPKRKGKPVYFGSAGKAPHTVYFGNAAAEYRRNMFEADLKVDVDGPMLQSVPPVYPEFRFKLDENEYNSDSDTTDSSADDDVPRHFMLLGKQPMEILSTRSLERAGPNSTFHFGTSAARGSDETSTISGGRSSQRSSHSSSSRSKGLSTPKAFVSERKFNSA